MEKRTVSILVGSLIVIAALAAFFWFMKNRSDWRTSDYPGSSTNWIGMGLGRSTFSTK